MSASVSPLPSLPKAAPGAPGGEGPVFLYFGNDWFAENRTSSHQLARQLARRHTVYYVECPGWRAPRGSARDLKKVFVKLWRFLRGTREVEGHPGLRLRTLFQVPFHRFRLVRWLNRVIVKTTLRLMMWRHGVRRPVTWFHVPHVPYLVGALGERLSVYYCIDDYAAYPGVNPEVVQAMDEETTRRADLVFIASDTLLERKRDLNPETRVSPHGVDIQHFGKALDGRTRVPADIASLTGPVIGFFGLLERFIDLDLIDYLAAQRPGWNFVLLGRVAVPECELPRRPNVHFLGRRPYEELPAYGKRFDAAVIPYRAGDWSYHANPIKLREYLAMGKPVVAVDTPQMRQFADVVTVARDREEFLAGLDAALASPPTPADTERRVRRVRQSGWDRRAGEVLRIIRQAAEVAPHQPAPSTTP
jgi:glycosyltransferase involved in cell wall biosynthesis